jgi:hypothetical protein
VIFQRAPFDFPDLSTGISCFLEEESRPIGQCPWNSAWILHCYGKQALNEMKDLPIFCSGTVMGDRDGLLAYLRAMIGEIAWTAGSRGESAFGADQGNHNHLLHRARLFPLAVMRNGGPVMHLHHRKREQLAFSPQGLLLNADGRVVNVVHQWDRHPDAFADLLAEFRRSGNPR